MTTVEADRLTQAIAQAHDAATAALAPQTITLDGVTWPSVHLAAVERALYPAALQHLPDARHRVHAQMTVDHRLQQALWWLDRRLTGSMDLATIAVDGLVDRIRVLLDEHTAGESVLVQDLCQALDDEQQEVLAARLETLMSRGPTRPHPHTPHRRMTDALTFTVESWVDRIRDQLDSRTICTPRVHRAPHPVGKWGAYLAALPLPPVQPDVRPGGPKDEA